MSSEPEVGLDSDDSEINFITAVEIEQDLFSNGLLILVISPYGYKATQNS